MYIAFSWLKLAKIGSNLDAAGSRDRSSTPDQETRTVSTCWINPGGLSLSPWSSFPCFFGFPCFFVARNFLAFLSVFPFLPKDFRGFSREKKSLLFPKKARKRRSGLRKVGVAKRGYHWHRNQSEAKQYDFQINSLQNYKSESESEIRGEVSMWIWMRNTICPININTKAKEYFRGINFTLISVSTVGKKVSKNVQKKVTKWLPKG